MSRRILIVDDEPDVRLYLQTVLAQHDFEVLSASTAREGLDIVREKSPDLVCLDIMMPRESGIKLYTQMKGDKKLAGIPVLVVSGVSPSSEFEFREFVSDTSVPPPEGYVEKPIQPEEFIKLVDRLSRRIGAGNGRHSRA
jgi:two-component system phosphate regulon response regulator PhoB